MHMIFARRERVRERELDLLSCIQYSVVNIDTLNIDTLNVDNTIVEKGQIFGLQPEELRWFRHNTPGNVEKKKTSNSSYWGVAVFFFFLYLFIYFIIILYNFFSFFFFYPHRRLSVCTIAIEGRDIFIIFIISPHNIPPFPLISSLSSPLPFPSAHSHCAKIKMYRYLIMLAFSQAQRREIIYTKKEEKIQKNVCIYILIFFFWYAPLSDTAIGGERERWSNNDAI